MDVSIDKGVIERKARRLERRFWRRRAERPECRYVSLESDLAAVRRREIYYIQACYALQCEVDEHKKEEEQLRAQVDWFIDTEMRHYDDEDEFQEIVANLREAAAKEEACYRAHTVFRKLRLHLRSLLAYTKLRLKLHINFVEACLRQAQAGVDVTDDQWTNLSTCFSESKYRVSHEHRPEIDERFRNIRGGFMVGHFELLYQEVLVGVDVRSEASG